MHRSELSFLSCFSLNGHLHDKPWATSAAAVPLTLSPEGSRKSVQSQILVFLGMHTAKYIPFLQLLREGCDKACTARRSTKKVKELCFRIIGCVSLCGAWSWAVLTSSSHHFIIRFLFSCKPHLWAVQASHLLVSVLRAPDHVLAQRFVHVMETQQRRKVALTVGVGP